MDNIGTTLESSEKLAPARQLRSENEAAMPGAIMRHGLPLYTLDELMAQEFPDELWLVDSLIPEGITVLSAKPASYKTWILLDIAIKVATGAPLFDHFVTEKTGVLMVDEENSARLLQHRLKLLGTENELPIHIMIEQNFRLDDKTIARAIEFCTENNVGLVTIDSLIRIYEGNENDSVNTAEVFKKLRRFTKAGILVLITHHHRKGGKGDDFTEEMRGSSDIRAACDCHIAISREEGHRLVLTQTKVRHSEEHDPVEVEIVSNDEHFEFKYLGTLKPTESKKIKTINEVLNILKVQDVLNQKELLEALEKADCKVNIKTLRTTLNQMVQDKLVTSLRGKGNELRYRLGIPGQNV